MCSFHVAHLVANNKGSTSATAVMGHSALRFFRDTSALDQKKKINDLYDELRPSLLAYLCGLGVSVDDADDIIQESFLRLVRHLLDKKKEDNLRGWVFRVAYNLAMDVHRELSRDSPDERDDEDFDRDESADTASNPEQMYLQAEQMTRLNHAIQRLNPQQRSCLLLRAEGLPFHEIGMVLGISTQRAALVLQRSLTRLAASFE